MFAIVALTGCKKDEVDDSDVPDPDAVVSIVFEDSNFEQALIDSGYDLNKDGYITADEALEVLEINVNNKGITSLVGLDYFENLMVLQCSNNSDLMEIAQFTNTKLVEITCDNTGVTFLDVCLCPDIEILSANTVTSIFVADEAQKEALEALVDGFAVADGCEFIIGTDPYEFADDNFRLALLNENNTIDVNEDGVISIGEVRVVKSIDVSADAMESVTKSLVLDATRATESATGAGNLKSLPLADFVALEELLADNNPGLGYLDVSQNAKLKNIAMNNVSVVMLSESQYADETFKKSMEDGTSIDAQVVSVSQEVLISNNDIKSYLVENYAGGDGILSYGEAATATKLELDDTTAMNIEKSILYLPSLEELVLSNCSALSSLDLGALGELLTLNLSGTSTLSEVDWTANGKLRSLNIAYTALTSADVSMLPSLESFDMSNTSIAEIDLTNNTELSALNVTSSLLTILNVTTCADDMVVEGDNSDSMIEYVYLSDAQGSNVAQWIDVVNGEEAYIYTVASGTPSLQYPSADSPITFTDDNFKAAVFAELGLEAEDDLTYEDAEKVTTLAVEGDFANVFQVKFFTGLTELSIESSSADLESVDVTKLTNLKSLKLVMPNATSFKELDLSFGYTEGSAPLTTLILSGTPALKTLTGTSVLTNLTHLALNDLYKIDEEDIDVSIYTKLTQLYLSGGESFTSFDLSKLTSLATLNVGETGISALDVTSNTKLSVLKLNDTDVSALDLSYNTAISDLDISNTSITILDISATSIADASSVSASGIIWLTISSAQAGDEAAAGYLEDWEQILAPGALAINVSQPDTYVIDFECNYFKDYLVGTLGVDTSGDGEITIAEAKACTGAINTTSYASTTSITSVEELKYFPNITGITLYTSTGLTKIDATYNLLITTIYANITNVTELYLPGGGVIPSTTMSTAYIQNSGAANINLSGFTALYTLFCGGSKMETLDLTGCTKLGTLSITAGSAEAFSEITGLSTCTALAKMTIGGTNYIQTLDISSISGLTTSTFALSSAVLPNLTKFVMSEDQYGANAANLDGWLTTVGFSTSATNESFAIYTVDSSGTETCVYGEGAVEPEPEPEPEVDEGGDEEDTATPEGMITFVDSAFETYVKTLSLDTDSDGYITETEAAAYTGAMSLSTAMTDLSDLKYFTGITSFSITATVALNDFDFSKNVKLTSISFPSWYKYQEEVNVTLPEMDGSEYALQSFTSLYTGVVSLDFTDHTNLTSISCGGSKFATLIVTGCSSLTTLDLRGGTTTSPTAIDFTGCSELTTLQLNCPAAYTGFSGGYTELDLTPTKITAETFFAMDEGGTIEKLPSLTKLVLTEAQYTGNSATWYAQIPDTAYIYVGDKIYDVNGSEVSADDIAYVFSDSAFGEYVATLLPDDECITEAELAAIAEMSIDCETYALANTTFSNDLKKCASLSSLTLTNNTTITTLDVSSTSITDASSLVVTGLTSLTLPAGATAADWTGLIATEGSATITVGGKTYEYEDGALKEDEVVTPDYEAGDVDADGNIVFGDDNFKDYIVANYGTALDANSDGEVSEAEANAYTGTIALSTSVFASSSVDVSTITDLTGIEHFTKMTQLNITSASGLDGATIDLTKCVALTNIGANLFWKIYDLILPPNGTLTTLNISTSALTSFDLSGYSSLTTLSFGSAYFEGPLNLTGCSGLTSLSFNAKLNTSSAVFNTLDISDCTSLTVSGITTSVYVITDLTLAASQVTDTDTVLAWAQKMMSTSGGTIKVEDGSSYTTYSYDGSAVTETGSGATTEPDVDDEDDSTTSDIISFVDADFETFAVSLGIDTNGDEKISVDEAAAYNSTMTFSTTYPVEDLTEIKYFTSITQLNLTSSTATTVDLSENNVLTSITANNAQLEDITLPTATDKLYGIYLQNNKLSSIDLSPYTGLKTVFYGSSYLESFKLASSLTKIQMAKASELLTTLDISGCASLATSGVTFSTDVTSSLTSLTLSETQAADMTGWMEAFQPATTEGFVVNVSGSSYSYNDGAWVMQ